MPINHAVVQQAVSCLNAGREDEARKLLATHLKKSPMDPGANRLLAMVHGAHDEFEQAAFCLRRTVAADPKDIEARQMLGNVLISLKKYVEAAQAYRACVAAAPHDAGSVMGLAQCLVSLGRLDEAISVMERGIAASPDDANMYGFMGSVLVAIGRVAQAMEVVKRGAARLPSATGLWDFVAQNSNFLDGVDAADHRTWHERIGAAWEQQASRPEPVFRNSPLTGRPLRVGFLSGDYGYHACAFFLKGLLLNLDRTRVIPHCYSTKRWADGWSKPFESACEWRDVSELSDDALASTIMADTIDILVECSGHFQGNRLRALTPRAAPVQCTYLGYPNTTGLKTIDYRIVDAITDPPENDWHLSEKPARIQGCFVCFSPFEGAPAIAPRDPACPVVFGSFNRLDKATDRTLDAWCSVLKEVAESSMVIKSRMMTKELKDLAVARFTSRGIDRSRIVTSDFIADPAGHLSLYNQIDIALDTFPYNGTTTTCEAVWMGVPVVTLMGHSHRARVGASLNTALGLESLIAENERQYVGAAVSLAHDRARLSVLRQQLRARMAASALCDGAGFARRFEELLATLWRAWCVGR